MNLPNSLTIFRIILAPLFLIAYLFFDRVLAISILLVSFATDLLDGYLARKWKTETVLGRALDGFADKIFMAFVAVALFLKLQFEVLQVFLFLTRDLFVLLLTMVTYCFTKGKRIVLSASKLSKGITGLQYLTVLFFSFSWQGGTILIYALSLLGIICGIDYSMKFYRAAKQTE